MKNRRFRTAGTLFLWIFVFLTGVQLSAAGLLVQEPQLNPPAPLPDVTYPAALDSNQVGQQSPVPNADVVKNASFFDPLDIDILRWQSFLQQARQIVAAGENSTIKSAKDEADRLSQIIPGAEAHLQALLTQQKLQQDLKNSKDCGLSQLMGDWTNLKQFVDQERERMGPASAMSQIVEAQSAGIYTKFGGAAGGSMISASASIMKRQMERDADASELAGSNIGIIVSNCLEKQAQQKEDAENKDAQKKLDDFKSKLAAATSVAHQKATEAREIAKKGQYKDAAKLRELMTTVAMVAQANQYMGNAEGDKLGKELSTAAIDFVTSFADDCMNQPAPTTFVVGLDRMSQLLGPNTDLSNCYNRLFEAIGLTGDLLPYRIRHCGKDLAGEWKIQVTRGTVNGAFGKLEGTTDVPQLAQVTSSTVPMPVLNTLTTSHFESAAAHIEASGRMGDKLVSLGNMRATGDITILVDTLVANPGVLLHMDMKMNAAITQQGFNATPNGGGMTTHYGARGGPPVAMPIVVINGNRPCDPGKDIFSYPTDR